MADEELHETTADDQNDLQSTNDTAAVEEGNKTVQNDTDETTVESASADSNAADDLDYSPDQYEDFELLEPEDFLKP